MNVAGEYEINFGIDKPALINALHAFTFSVVLYIAIVDGHMHDHNKPRCLLPVYSC